MIGQAAIDQSKWYAKVDPISKLLLIAGFTLASFVISQPLLELPLLAATALLIMFSRKTMGVWAMTAFSLFLIMTMLLIQGLFWPGNHTLALKAGILLFYQEGLTHALLLGCRILVIIFSTCFFIETTTISENAKYLEAAGLSYKQVYVLMSVCYILPEMKQNLQKIQLAQRARGIVPAKSVWSRVEMIVPVLVPLIIKTFQMAINRSISLQLRGYDSSERRKPELKQEYWLGHKTHLALSLICLFLIGGKAWLLVK